MKRLSWTTGQRYSVCPGKGVETLQAKRRKRLKRYYRVNIEDYTSYFISFVEDHSPGPRALVPRCRRECNSLGWDGGGSFGQLGPTAASVRIKFSSVSGRGHRPRSAHKRGKTFIIMNSISRYTFVNTLIFIKKGLIKTFFRAGSFLRTRHFIMYGNAFPCFPSPPNGKLSNRIWRLKHCRGIK